MRQRDLFDALRRGLAMCCLVAVLAGCADLPFLAPKEPVTIRFVYPGEAAYYEPLIEEFQQEYRHVSVELVSGQSVRMETIAEQDVIVVPQFFLEFLIEEEYPIDLNTLISEDADFTLDDFYATGVDLLSTGGQRWAIPYMADLMVMAYNKDLFDKRNVPYPETNWNWDQFLDRALSLTDRTEGEFGFTYHQSGQISMYEIMILMYQRGGRLFDDLQEPTAMIINDPNNIAAMQWYADLIHRHYVAPSPQDWRVPFPETGIESGKFAMWMEWLSDIGRREEYINVGVAPIPSGQFPLTMGTVYGIAISSATLDPEACWAWVSFISERVPPALMPLRRSLAEADAALTTIGPEAAEAGRVSLPNMIGMNFSPGGQLWSKWGIAMQALSAALVAIQNGDPVAPALDAAQRKVNF